MNLKIFESKMELTVTETFQGNLPEDLNIWSFDYTDKNGNPVIKRIAKKTSTGLFPDIQDRLMTEKRSYDYYADSLNKYCYYFEYNSEGQVIKQFVPGMEPVYNIYDKRGRLVMTQSGNLRKEGKWSYTKYDIFDRPVLSGIYSGGTYEYHDSLIRSQTCFGKVREGTSVSYSSHCYPYDIDSSEILSVNYYDDYLWCSSGYDFNDGYSLGGTPNTDIVGLATGTKTRVLGDGAGQWLTSAIYYDNEYNTIQNVTDLYPSGKEIVANTHDFTGDVTQTKVVQLVGGHVYGYDKWFNADRFGRLLSIDQQIIGDVNGKVRIAEYTYDELGAVVTNKSLHKGLSGVGYGYRVNGNCERLESDYFSYDIVSDRGFANLEGLPNGNIAHVLWKKDPGSLGQGYSYSYDNRNQMTEGVYVEGTFDKHIGMPEPWAPLGSYSESNISYDPNGNILTLDRLTEAGNQTSLEYRYEVPGNGNAVSSVAVDGDESAQFLYDADGNMTFDGMTGVGIEYNVLGLLRRIFAGDSEITYIYSASGEKLAAVAPDGSLTYYRSVMTYGRAAGAQQETLLQMHHPEGMVALEGGDWVYKYFITDHLGSVRAVFSARKDSAGQPVTVLEQSTDFYPFGLAHEANDLHVNKYLFSGKELQDASLDGESLLGLYDFHARYSPSISDRLS